MKLRFDREGKERDRERKRGREIFIHVCIYLYMHKPYTCHIYVQVYV